MRAPSGPKTPEAPIIDAARASSIFNPPAALTSYNHRGRLSNWQLRDVLVRRFGSLHDFSQVIASYAVISRATGLNHGTLRRHILWFLN